MSWQGIEGHDDVVEGFRRCLAAGRLASTFLFVGPEGVGKQRFALRLAQSLLCDTRSAAELDPCGRCPSCIQVAAGTHPDVLVVSKPKEKSTIPVELLIGSGDKRMREGLCHDIGLKSFSGKYKIAIIDDADYLNVEGANCLLKTLEEPPPRSLLILIGTSLERQLPTIRSRAQIVRFAPLPAETLAILLIQQGQATDRQEALRLATYAEGSLARAMELADPELWKFRSELFTMLARIPIDAVRGAKRTAAFVDQAGSDAGSRRERLRQVILFAVEFFRQLLRQSSSAPTTDDADLRSALGSAAHLSADQVTEAIDVCLTAHGYVDRNANQATIIDWWWETLAKTLRAPQASAR
jgi:DNA polymerase-3 subunit delta'